jgi:hypothetical protein
MPNLPSEIAYCSLLSYPTHPNTRDEQHAKDVSVDLKQGRRYTNPPCTISQLIAQRVLEQRDLPAFEGFFGPDVLAIPVPSSSLKRPGSLWIPQDLAYALKDAGLVGDVMPLLERTTALPKSAFSLASERSKAMDHYGSVQVSMKLIAPSSILLVDDVITRGATMLGVAGRVMESYPSMLVQGFAAMRAVSNQGEFKSLMDPCCGKVTLQGDQTRRRP